MGAERFQLLHDIHALNHTAEDNVLVVEPAGLHSGNEELTAVGVGTSIGHGHDTRSGVLELEVFVSELATVDGLATSAIVVGEVTTLAHEVGDDTVEDGALVAKALLASAECPEVLSSLGDNIASQLNHDPAGGLAVDGHVEENAWEGHGFTKVPHCR